MRWALIVLMTAAALAGDGSYDLLTVNVWGLPDPIARDRAGRLPKVGEWLVAADPDLVGIQELWRGARAMLTVPSLFTPRLEGGDTGLAVLSPRRVRDLRASSFGDERGLDALKSKGMLEATMDLDGRDVHVLVTHLQAGGGDRNATVRAHQVDELLARLDGELDPSVVLGDFNLYAGNAIDRATERVLEAAGLIDAAAVAGDGSATYPGTVDRYDRILLRSGSAAAWTVEDAHVVTWADTRLSDHYAVAATVRLEEP